MDFDSLYHFLFETIEGTGCLVVACLVLTTIIAAVLERKTRNAFKDRGPRPDDDDWKFDDEKKDDR